MQRGVAATKIVRVLVLVLEGKCRSGLRRLHVGLVGFVTGSVLGATLYRTFEHEDEHEHEHEKVLAESKSLLRRLTRKGTCPTVTGSSGWLGRLFRDAGFPIKYGDRKIA